MYRFLEEEAKKQLNIEGIAQKAIPLLEEGSDPGRVDSDWITNFFDKSRIVSDNDMQILWAKVLAGEANAPGAFSRKTVNLLGDLDKNDAELFAILCRFGWVIDRASPLIPLIPLILDVSERIYNDNGIYFATLSHLENLGLIQYGSLTGYSWKELPKSIVASYQGMDIQLTLPNESSNSLGVGKVLLTRAGRELSQLCDSKPVDGFFDHVYDKWAELSLVPKREAK
jgi:hypothetical protein